MTSLLQTLISRSSHAGYLMMSTWRKIVIRLVNADVRFGQNVRIDRNVIIRTYDGGSVYIGDNTHVWPGSILEARSGSIKIGEDSLINTGVNIVAVNAISIGKDALIAEFVSIRDQDHNSSDPSVPYRLQGRTAGAITIGDNVWLGAKVTVTRNVTIDDGIVVGANSVVTRSLSGAQKFVGSPARPLLKKT